jgi:hypothetical protein
VSGLRGYPFSGLFQGGAFYLRAQLTDRVLQLEEKQQDFIKSMNQRLNAIGERQEEG